MDQEKILIIVTVLIFVVGSFVYVYQSRAQPTPVVAPKNLPIILTSENNHVTFNGIPVKLTAEGVPLRLNDSSVLTGIGVTQITVLHARDGSGLVQLGKIKPDAIILRDNVITNIVLPTGSSVTLDARGVTYTLKYLTPIQI